MNKLVNAGIIILAALSLVLAISSLRWRLEHDSPILFYIAYQIDQNNKTPYRDIFDMNMPGTYLAYSTIGRLASYKDAGIRVVDLFLLSVISGLTWLTLRKLDRRSAWFGSLMWSFWYLSLGPIINLQREFLILVPIAGAVYLSTIPRTWSSFAWGFCFGIAATIKPHSAIAMLVPLVTGYAGVNKNKNQYLKTILFPSLIGFAVPLLLIAVYLWIQNAFGAFLDLTRNYWPLYAQLTGEHVTISGAARVEYIFRKYRELGGVSTWLVTAVLGTYLYLFYSSGDPDSNARRRLVLSLTGYAACFSLYTMLAGQFWQYHWLPFSYFIIQLSSLCLAKLQNLDRAKSLFAMGILAIIVFLATPVNSLMDIVKGAGPKVPKNGRVDEIATFLKKNLKEGDSVQPLDWTGGAVHSMLIARASPATSFVYDFHFYHHKSQPYIQKLRERFLKELRQSKPRYIIEVIDEKKPWVSGEDTTQEFSELHEILQNQYHKVAIGNGYVIHEIRPSRTDRAQVYSFKKFEIVTEKN